MIVVTRKLIAIDAEVSVTALLETWKNGNLSDVYDALTSDHAGLTAMFMLEGIRNKILTQTDCNQIVNRLIDDRVKLCNA